MQTTEQRPLMMSTETAERLCGKHGVYQSRVFSGPAQMSAHSACPQCTAERDAVAQDLEQRRRIDAVASNVRNAAIPLRFSRLSLSDFATENEGQRKACAVAGSYVKKWAQVREKGAPLIFCGEFGTGKTMLACAVLRQIIEAHGATGLYATALNAVRRIKDTWRQRDHVSETEKEAIAAFVQPDLLVLDEVGVQFGSEPEKLLLFDILNGRYEDVKPTILISNQNVNGMGQYLGPRVMDRMKEGGGMVLPFEWKSYREGA